MVITVPSALYQAISKGHDHAKGPIMATWSWDPVRTTSLLNAPRVAFETNYLSIPMDEARAKRAGRIAFAAFYNALGIYPGQPDWQDEVSPGDGWSSAQRAFEAEGFLTHIEHRCIDKDAGETNADAEARGCDGDEACGWRLTTSKWSDVAWAAFEEALMATFPNEEERNYICGWD
jgi:hypothetical protein